VPSRARGRRARLALVQRGTDELSTADELAAGLLPADAFGPEANVVTIDIRQ
jgi:hypothetical protein